MKNSFIKNSLISLAVVPLLMSISFISADANTEYVSEPSADINIMHFLQNTLDPNRNNNISFDIDGSMIVNNKSYNKSDYDKYHVDDILNAMQQNGITHIYYQDGVAKNQNGDVIDVIPSDNQSNNSGSAVIPINNNSSDKDNKQNKPNDKQQNENNEQKKDNNQNTNNSENHQINNKNINKQNPKKVTIKSVKRATSSINKQLHNKHLTKKVRNILLSQRSELRKESKNASSINKINKQLQNKHLTKKARRNLIHERVNIKNNLQHEVKVANLNAKLMDKHLNRKERKQIVRALNANKNVNKLQNKLNHKHMSHKNRVKLNKKIKSLKQLFNRLAK